MRWMCDGYNAMACFTRAVIRLELDTRRRNGGFYPSAGGERQDQSEPPSQKRRQRLATDGLPGAPGMDGCTLGGRRAWLLCPAQGCGRRVALLYIGGAGIFACRHCYKLAYQCQRETDDDRAMRRADNIRRRLGWEAGIATPEGDKPKGMHWRTYERLVAQHDVHVEASLTGMALRLGLIGWGLDGIDVKKFIYGHQFECNKASLGDYLLMIEKNAPSRESLEKELRVKFFSAHSAGTNALSSEDNQKKLAMNCFLSMR